MADSLVNVALKNVTDIKEQLEKIGQRSERVVNRTVNDFKTRGPAWISAAVSETYNIKKSEVSAALSSGQPVGKTKVAGKLVNNVKLVYRGNLLTPLHFKMRPSSRPAPDKRGKVKPYNVTAEIFKGQRKKLGTDVFLGKGRNTDKSLPFQRKGKERLPVKIIRTLSIPQMIKNEKVSESIMKNISTGLGKRLEHHMNRELK